MISKIPCTSAQAPMNSTSRIAVMPGQAKVTIPAAIPSRPTSTSHQFGAGWRRRESGDQRNHAIDEREGAIQQHQCDQGQSWPDERQDAENDGGNPAQEQQPPALGQCVSIGRPGNGAVISRVVRMTSSLRVFADAIDRSHPFDFGPRT